MDKIEKTISVLKDGGIVIFPTDTAYGIGCRMDWVDSVKKLFQIRRRPESKPMLALVSDITMAEQYVTISDTAKKNLINKYWPGALTIILQCDRKKVPSIVRAGGGTLAVRIPDHPHMQYIIQQLGVPILAPSANFAGETTPHILEEVDSKLISLVDFVLPGECTMKGVSTIIDATVSPWKIVRKGIIAL